MSSKDVPVRSRPRAPSLATVFRPLSGFLQLSDFSAIASKILNRPRKTYTPNRALSFKGSCTSVLSFVKKVNAPEECGQLWNSMTRVASGERHRILQVVHFLRKMLLCHSCLSPEAPEGGYKKRRPKYSTVFYDVHS